MAIFVYPHGSFPRKWDLQRLRYVRISTVSANSVTAENLTMMPDATYILGAGDKLTVKKELKSE